MMQVAVVGDHMAALGQALSGLRPALDLIALPEDLRAAIDEKVPPRWSRGNPIDLAGGETRDTIPEVLDLVCAHPDVDAVIHLGIGIQAAQAQAFRSGPFFANTVSSGSSSSTSARIAATRTPHRRRPSVTGRRFSLPPSSSTPTAPTATAVRSA